MKTGLVRTNKTELTDDELILFDVMFNCSCPINVLKKEKFVDQFNANSHKLSDEQLKETLTKLNEKKFVRFLENRDSLEKISNHQFRKIKTTFVELTSKGGKFWEKEREPIWEKYHIQLCDYVNKNKRIITITSTSLKTIESYLKIAQKLNFEQLTEIYDVSFKVEQRKSIEGLRWKKFAEIHTATIVGWQSDEDSERWQEIDWKYYYENLNWWSNVHELNVLKRKEFQNSYE